MDTPTIYDICQHIQIAEDGRTHRSAKPVTTGMEPRPIEHIEKEGLYTLEPDEILTIHVEQVTEDADGNIVGFQRPLQNASARAVARAIKAGRNIAPPTVALDEGCFYAPDGQHRLVGAVIAREPLKVSIELLNQKERIARFADQALSRKPSADVLILGRAGTDPVARYIRDGIEATNHDADHPLAGYVGQVGTPYRIGVATTYSFLAPYALKRMAVGAEMGRRIQELSQTQRNEITTDLLDEGAGLLTIYGAKFHAHKLAYAPATVRALADLAVTVVRRSDNPTEAADRWRRVMASFNFNTVKSDMTRHLEIRFLLAKKWNSNRPERFIRVNLHDPE